MPARRQRHRPASRCAASAAVESLERLLPAARLHLQSGGLPPYRSGSTAATSTRGIRGGAVLHRSATSSGVSPYALLTGAHSLVSTRPGSSAPPAGGLTLHRNGWERELRVE